MKSSIGSLSRPCLLVCALATVAGAANADITVEENLSVNGGGLMKMANMSGRTVTTISGNRSRTDSDLRFESAMVRLLARGAGATTEIVRLDDDKILELNQKKKTYTETSIAARREQLQQAMQKMQESQASQQQAATGVDEEQCEWSQPSAEVKRSGEKATIGGYPSERVTINATQQCKDKKTGQVCEFGLALDQWIAPGFEASEERLAYQRAYAEKLGLTAATSRDFAERAQTLFSGYEGIWTEVAAKMRDVNGYPVKSSFVLGVGGPQCENPQAGAPTGDSAPPSIGLALGGAFGGLLNRKKEPQPVVATTPAAVPPNGLIAVMTVTTELVAVNRNPVATDVFTVPADFKLAKD